MGYSEKITGAVLVQFNMLRIKTIIDLNSMDVLFYSVLFNYSNLVEVASADWLRTV